MATTMASFVPEYNSILTTDDITRRKEFQVLQYDYDADFYTASHKVPGTFFNHQNIVIRAMMEYDRCFLFQRAGTGKTCCYIGVCEALKDLYLKGMSNIKHFVILTDINIEKSLLESCTNIYNNSKEYKKYYSIYGEQKFKNLLDNIKNSFDDQDLEKYDDTLFILDEAQKIKSVELEKTMLTLFSKVKRFKIIVATATPILDSPEDILPLLRYMLVDKECATEVTPAILDGILSANDISGKSNEIFSKLRKKFFDRRLGNAISFVRELDTKVDINYVGQKKGQLFNLDLVEMTDAQVKKLNALTTDTDTFSARTKEIQLEVSSDLPSKPPPGHKNLLLKNLEKTSPKIVYILDLLNKYPNDNFFIFSSDLKTTINFLGNCLEKNGFSRFEGIGGMNKFAVYDGDTKESVRQQIKTVQQRPDNWNGSKLRIVLAGKAGTVGISFFNVKHVICLSGDWNYSNLYQGIYRAIRADSHTVLRQKLGTDRITLNVYMLCAVLPLAAQQGSVTRKTTDEEMYARVEVKEEANRKIERALKRLAFDCILNYERNVVRKMDGSAECDYEECEWFCDTQEQLPLRDKEYKLLYEKEDTTVLEMLHRTALLNIKDLSFEAVNNAIGKQTVTSLGIPGQVVLSGEHLSVRNGYTPNLKNRHDTAFYFDNLVFRSSTKSTDEIPEQKELKNALIDWIQTGNWSQTLTKYQNYWFLINKNQVDAAMETIKNKKSTGPKTKSGMKRPENIKKIIGDNIKVEKYTNQKLDDYYIITNIFIRSVLREPNSHARTARLITSQRNEESKSEIEYYTDGKFVSGDDRSQLFYTFIRNYYENRLNSVKYVTYKAKKYYVSKYPDTVNSEGETAYVLKLHTVEAAKHSAGSDISQPKKWKELMEVYTGKIDIGVINAKTTLKEKMEVLEEQLRANDLLFEFE